MAASSRGAKAAMALIRSSRNPQVCSSCLATISRRPYSAAAAAVETKNDSPAPPQNVTTKQEKTTSIPEYIIKSGILLSRPPLITKTLSPFEEAFFFYQKRLNERLVMPFSRYFYFKPKTPADMDWKVKAKERNLQPARELGGYNPYSKEGWNDELLVGDKLSQRSSMVDALLRDAEMRVMEGKDGKTIMVEEGAEADVEESEKVEKPLERFTAADKEKDQRRLDRKLGRTLYLCVKRKNSGWGFPAGELIGRESLYQAAERVLVQTAGMNMNTWFVSHAPVGHYITIPRRNEDSSLQKPGEKTFFMKGRIMAGQASLVENIYGLEDFKWLTKQEIQKHVGVKYYSRVKNMLADR